MLVECERVSGSLVLSLQRASPGGIQHSGIRNRGGWFAVRLSLGPLCPGRFISISIAIRPFVFSPKWDELAVDPRSPDCMSVSS
jgi:hypothetical protein